jgi:hypothetical protein
MVPLPDPDRGDEHGKVDEHAAAVRGDHGGIAQGQTVDNPGELAGYHYREKCCRDIAGRVQPDYPAELQKRRCPHDYTENRRRDGQETDHPQHLILLSMRPRRPH